MTSTQETMRDGHFALTYRYTPKGGSSDGSNDIFGEGWASFNSPVFPCTELKYREDELTIDFIIYPFPIPIESYSSVRFTLAFRGTLGREEGVAVIGKCFTLGEIKFNEEWDRGLTGNHSWAHTDFNFSNQNPQNGQSLNFIKGDVLVKDNIRYAGYRSNRINESFVDDQVDNGRFRDILPILITPNTYIEFKIDAMSINQPPPSSPGTTSHWQYLLFRFNNGLSIQYSQVGQAVYIGPKTVYFSFDLGLIIVDNIYKAFQGAGIVIPNGPLYLTGIGFVQHLFIIDAPSTVEHHQHMEVDFIRIVEGKEQ
jgi:hypothetical protein